MPRKKIAEEVISEEVVEKKKKTRPKPIEDNKEEVKEPVKKKTTRTKKAVDKVVEDKVAKEEKPKKTTKTTTKTEVVEGSKPKTKRTTKAKKEEVKEEVKEAVKKKTTRTKKVAKVEEAPVEKVESEDVVEMTAEELVNTTAVDDIVEVSDDVDGLENLLNLPPSENVEEVTKPEEKVERTVPEPEKPAENAPVEPVFGSVNIGNPNLYIYYDINFMRSYRDAIPYSIALVDQAGRTFYAEFSSYPPVVSDVLELSDKLNDPSITRPMNSTVGDHWTYRGNRRSIKTQIYNWLGTFVTEKRPVQFVSAKPEINFELLREILSSPDDGSLPENFSPVSYDITHDLANYISSTLNPSVDVVPIMYAGAIPLTDIVQVPDDCKDLPEFSIYSPLYRANAYKAIHRLVWGIQ